MQPVVSDIQVLESVTNTFLASHTRFGCLKELFAAGGFVIESQEDFEALNSCSWSKFIRSVSDFPDWQTLLLAALGERGGPMSSRLIRRPPSQQAAAWQLSSVN